MAQNSTTTSGTGLSNLFQQANSNTTGQSGPTDAGLAGFNAAMNQANQIYSATNQGQQFGTMNPMVSQGIQSQFDAANRNAGWSQLGPDALAGILSNHPEWDVTGYREDAANQMWNDVSPAYKQMAQQLQYPLAAETNLSGLAQNTSGNLTSTQQAILDQNAERQSNRLASLYSGSGRTGSFGAGIGMARGIAETNNPLTAQFNQQNIQNALNANQQMTGATLGRTQLGQGALAGESASAMNMAALANQEQGIRMQAAGMMPGAIQGTQLPGQEMQQAGSSATSYPWENLRNYASTLGGLQGLTPRANTQTNVSTAGGLQNNVTNQLQQTATPWTTFAGLGVAGLGLLAKGGPARGGRPYLVGEKGPELFIPRAMGGAVRPMIIGPRGPQLFRPPVSGQVIPNSALRGPQSITPQVSPGFGVPGRAFGGPVRASGAMPVMHLRAPQPASVRGPMPPRIGGGRGMLQPIKMGRVGSRRPLSPWAMGA